MCSVAKPADYAKEDGTPLVIGDESNESTSSESSEDSAPETYYASGIYTKYPVDPQDEYRTVSGEIVTADARKKRADSEFKDAPANGNKTENAVAKPKIPLQGLISAVEGDLVNKAKAINAVIKNSQPKDGASCNDGTTTSPKSAEKDFFDEINNSTKVSKRSDDKSARIPLDGLVKAVESTLIHSAKLVKRNAEESTTSIASTTKSDEGKQSVPAAVIHVEQLNSSKGSSHLNVLAPIAATSTTTEPTITTVKSNTEPSSIQLQHTNLTVVHTSQTIQITPNEADNSLHVKHQQIQKSIFHSNLAIFPTIPPETINAPLPTGSTSTESNMETSTNLNNIDDHQKSDGDHDKKKKLLSKNEELQEKIAEIQADPVILSQF